MNQVTFMTAKELAMFLNLLFSIFQRCSNEAVLYFVFYKKTTADCMRFITELSNG